MKHIVLIFLGMSLFFGGCEKADSKEIKQDSIEVSVKVVDALCADIILEIQEDSLKNYGDEIFNHKDNNYLGVVLINTAHCLSEQFLSNIYESGKVRAGHIFKTNIVKATSQKYCDKATCLATFSKLPTSVYSIVE